MAQIAMIVISILGLCKVVSLNAVCIVTLSCTAVCIIADSIKNRLD